MAEHHVHGLGQAGDPVESQGRDVPPLHPLLHEEDSLNMAVYVMFKENIRQPAVVRDGQIVGIVNLIDIFSVLLDVAGDQCFWV